MHTAMEHKLQLIASNLSCHNTIFLRTSIRNRKGKFNDQKEDLLPPIFSKRGRPNLGRDGIVQKAK